MKTIKEASHATEDQNNGMNNETYFVLPREPDDEFDGSEAYHWFRELSTDCECWVVVAHPTTLGPDYVIFQYWHDEDTFFYTEPMTYDHAVQFHQNLERTYEINDLSDVPF